MFRLSFLTKEVKSSTPHSLHSLQHKSKLQSLLYQPRSVSFFQQPQRMSKSQMLWIRGSLSRFLLSLCQLKFETKHRRILYGLFGLQHLLRRRLKFRSHCLMIQLWSESISFSALSSLGQVSKLWIVLWPLWILEINRFKIQLFLSFSSFPLFECVESLALRLMTFLGLLFRQFGRLLFLVELLLFGILALVFKLCQQSQIGQFQDQFVFQLSQFKFHFHLLNSLIVIFQGSSQCQKQVSTSQFTLQHSLDAWLSMCLKLKYQQLLAQLRQPIPLQGFRNFLKQSQE